MKILQLSDLHIQNIHVMKYPYYPVFCEIQNVLNTEDPDVVIITGDIFESNITKGMHKALSDFFGNRKVICTLGNHEFFYRTIDKTLKIYEDDYNPDKYDVHYLDVVDYVDIESLRFLGNVLWYDGSMATIKNQDLYEFGPWMDKTIKEFDYNKACFDCIKKIRRAQSDDHINILCSHTVPYELMNGHMTKLDSPYNAYSGIKNLLIDLDVYYSFSGHTHWRIEHQFEFNNHTVYCYNCGSNYGLLKFYLVNI